MITIYSLVESVIYAGDEAGDLFYWENTGGQWLHTFHAQRYETQVYVPDAYLALKGIPLCP